MDLLGSILDSMDKPPSRDEKKKEQIKKQREQEEQIKNKQRKELERFRKYAEERISRFLNDERKHLQFQPLDRAYRSIIHDIAETSKLVTMGFGVDGIDRYIVVYKKEHFPPSDDEITARKNGEDWNEETSRKYAIERELNSRLDEEQPRTEQDIVPSFNYKDKYVHLIGQEVALEAAKLTVSNKTYGYVPSANKKDQRSIEQTMADIQAKKKQKTQHDNI
ncbi:sperm-associated antigen 7 [Culicoides brevitarsis]|uniref:sperm-associated antigen 7 n=1 Tax=Culicoides brevitarsis TaxID=469753 RepID=UPI00307C383B